jgi:hypothetical protein
MRSARTMRARVRVELAFIQIARALDVAPYITLKVMRQIVVSEIVML